MSVLGPVVKELSLRTSLRSGYNFANSALDATSKYDLLIIWRLVNKQTLPMRSEFEFEFYLDRNITILHPIRAVFLDDAGYVFSTFAV